MTLRGRLAAVTAVLASLVVTAAVLSPSTPSAALEAASSADRARPTDPTAISAAISAARQMASRTAQVASPTTRGCARPAGESGEVRPTTVRLPSPVVGYGGEGDTERLPLALASRPDGTSWLAWTGTDEKVHLGRLGCDDRLTGRTRSFTGIDLQDVQAASDGGGVLLLTRRGTCGDGPLCGGTSSPCNTMHMIRFDARGTVQWQRQVTNLGAGRTGYSDGARFVWWYQHHGRLATDGRTWAAYFGVAVTVQNGRCVDIHQGGSLQVVSRRGRLRPRHPDAAEVGCGHSWTSRVVWDPRARHFVAVCATDNGCRIALPDPYRTVAQGTCDGTLFGGDLVLAKGAGYWTAWSQGGEVRLDRFTDGPSSTSLRTGVASAHPHLVSYGTDRMLLAWQDGDGMSAQVRDAATGAAVGEPIAIGVPDHDYQAFKAYPDGSVAYPAAGRSARRVVVARVLPQR